MNCGLKNADFEKKCRTVAPISKCSILFEVKEGENFNRRNILDISRIKI
jgi:hypothetical protein